MANFGILQPIQAPQMMGSLPSTPAGPGAGDAIGGLLQGIQQGQAQAQQSQMNDQKMQAMAQEMNQQAQMFPQQLERAQTENQTAKLNLQDAEQRNAYAAKLNDFADKTENQYLQQLRPDDRYKILTQKAEMNKAIAEAKKSGVEAAFTVTTGIAMANSAAMQYQDPKEQQAAYNHIKSQLPEDVQSTMTEFNPAFAPIAVAAGMRAEAQQLQSAGKSAPDNRTGEQKNAARLAELDQKEADGSITPQEQKEKTRLDELTQKNPDATALEDSQGLVDKYQAELDKIKNKKSPAAIRLQEKIDEAQDKIKKDTSRGVIADTLSGIGDLFSGGKSAITSQAEEATPIMKVLNGQQYTKINGKWYTK